METAQQIANQDRTASKRGWITHVRTSNARPDGYLDIIDEYRDARGVLHRMNGPAQIVQETKNKRRVSTYYFNGIPHRDNGPAVLICEHGKLVSEQWLEYGKLHRFDGPAEIKYLPNGTTRAAHYLNGVFIKSGPSSPTLAHLVRALGERAVAPTP